MKDGYIKDYISGEEIKATPEEVEAVQVFSEILVEDYGYPKEQLQTRPQWRVKVRPSDTKKEYPIDIGVFSSDKKSDDSLFIVVECKRKTRKDGLTQLKNYLTFSTARLGVWFNGEERLYIKKTEKAGKVLFSEIPNIPRNGERIEDIGRFKRKDLTIPHNLKVVFKAIRNHLAGNTVGATRDEVLAQQLINIIFCKIYDERFTKQEEMVEFRAGVDESDKVVSKRIKDIFKKVQTKYKEVIDFSDKISLDDKSVVYIVGELQNYCLTGSERDVVADAFETFIGYALKGGQGQFFTPRNIVRLMVEIIKPQPDQLIIDPACGSGGFLVESLKFMWGELETQSKEYGWSDLALQEEKMAAAIHNIRGIEKDEFLSKVSKAYMAIIGDGKGGIFCEDSLEVPNNWKDKTKQSIELSKFDVLLTNPPFGKDIKVVGESKLAQYDLANKWKKEGDVYKKTDKKNTEMRPEVLFIERSLQLLKDGGTMGIVLPETFFHAPRARPVMQFMENHNIKWVIDLPHNTFRPHNNAKCIIIVLQKNTKQSKNINFAVAEEMGHDHQGKEIYRWDPITQRVDKEQTWDDIKLIIEENRKSKKKYIFSVDSKQVKDRNIFVPRYYWETRDKEVEEIAKAKKLKLISIKQLINEGVIKHFDGHGSPPAEYKGRGDISYIRVKDIVNWEVYKDPTSSIPENIYKKMKGENKNLNVGDILYVRRGSYRIGSVAMVSPHDTNVLLTREILVLRVVENNKYGLTPHYLLYLLSHRLVAMQAFNKVLIETTLPNIANRWQELKLPLFIDEDMAKTVTTQIEEVIKAKWSAIEKLHKVKGVHGELVT
ncbi:N-6 DNA methylase [Candidatus Woesearchaeota archaeon]|mgnify:CR=1 FL=1|jgi:type I restriction enzyme M protein|nr:N-6 DNA methylase [Candidatus Woesearchaeota archaeon]MBT4732740.1 N-6 DNA methylase [Candidatus Woesearchaeota archaeon]